MTCSVAGCRRERRPNSPAGDVFGVCVQHFRLDLSAPAMGALASPRQRSHRSSGPRIPVLVQPPPA